MLCVNHTVIINTDHNTNTSFDTYAFRFLKKLVVVLCRLWKTRRVIQAMGAKWVTLRVIHSFTSFKDKLCPQSVSMHNFVFLSHGYFNDTPNSGREDCHVFVLS